jgi:hypothetical protein
MTRWNSFKHKYFIIIYSSDQKWPSEPKYAYEFWYVITLLAGVTVTHTMEKCWRVFWETFRKNQLIPSSGYARRRRQDTSSKLHSVTQNVALGWLTLRLCIQDVRGSNLDPNFGYLLWYSSQFSPVPSAIAGTVFQIRPRPFSST